MEKHNRQDTSINDNARSIRRIKRIPCRLCYFLRSAQDSFRSCAGWDTSDLSVPVSVSDPLAIPARESLAAGSTQHS